MNCSQCSRPAMYKLPSGHLLCLDCYAKVQQVTALQNENLERMINYLHDEMDFVLGMPTSSPRFPTRAAPVIQHLPVNNYQQMNNIKIDRSIIGAVNSGSINSLEVKMNDLSNINKDGAEKLKELTEEVLKDSLIKEADKTEIMQQLEFISEQLALKPEQRNSGVLRIVADNVSKLVQVSTGLVVLFDNIKTLLGIV